MNYWDYRKQIAKIIPRLSLLFSENVGNYKMKEKGRKGNYQQFNLMENQFVKMERLLDVENINSFLEVSLRAQSCPMPLNVDVWDGIKCPYACRYCFADYFRHSLYTSFFDNSKKMGLRHSSIDSYKKQLDNLFRLRGSKNIRNNDVENAVRLEIPMRLGIRFEDFPPIEERKEISLELLRYLNENNYPVMINTKSHIPGKDKYVKVLSGNKAGSAIHFTIISSDESFLKKIEPGAPSFEKRIEAAKNLSDAGVRVVARIEPWLMFLNDDKEMVDDYIHQIKNAGIKHLTFDSYSYSAKSKGISENFKKIGIDFQRMFLTSSDSQWLSSFMLGKFMEYFRENGLECSTFDQGNVPDNNDIICCSVGDFFKTGFNYGSGVVAIRFIHSRGNKSTKWSDFENFVNSKGGFLSESLKREVKLLWNGIGDSAWPIYWSRGIYPVGSDENGIIWKYKNDDFRKNLLESVL